jgi:putative addiction module CopG family antidote
MRQGRRAGKLTDNVPKWIYIVVLAFAVVSRGGAPRSMKMGNIASPWRYDVAFESSPLPPNARLMRRRFCDSCGGASSPRSASQSTLATLANFAMDGTFCQGFRENSGMPTRNISLTPEQDAFVESVVEAGEYQNASEAVRDALRALQQRRREDALKLKALRMRGAARPRQRAGGPRSRSTAPAL